MDKTAKFWNRIAEYYSKRPVNDEAAYRKKLEKTRSYFRPDMEILEFGCGTGTTAIAHAPYVKHILAIDFSTEMIRICLEKAEVADINNITFQCSSFDDFSAPDASFDVVLGLNTLHLLDNWEEVIRRAHKMLKPGGVFISSTPCIGDTIFRFFKPVAFIGHFFGLLPMLRIFTAKHLEKCLTDTGFFIDYQWLPKKNSAVFMVAKRSFEKQKGVGDN